jgi:pimeloyl-ACP methyl ester carboxylesterase
MNPARFAALGIAGVLAAGAAAGTAASPARSPAGRLDEKAIEAYAKKFLEKRPRTAFAEWDETERTEQLSELARYQGEIDGHLGPIVEILHKSAKKQLPRSTAEFETPFGAAKFLVKAAAKPKGKGLLLGLHGGGEGEGDARSAMDLTLPDCLGIYPQGIRLVHDTWNTIHGERFVLTLIERAKIHEEVDPDRVYVSGFSMGGTGSWFFAGRHPDLFAAAAPGPGVFMANPKSQVRTKEEIVALQHGFLPNVRNLPVSFYIGLADENTMPGTYLFAWDRLQDLREKDPGGYRAVEFRAFEGLAHAYPPGEPKKSLAFLAGHRRDPYPTTIVWEYASDPFPQRTAADPIGRYVKRQFYWLRCREPVDRMIVRARREGNVFDLEFERVKPKRVEILLRPEMFDPEKEVVVRVGGKEAWSGTVDPDLRVIFDTFDSYLDRRLTFDRWITITP